VRIDQIEADSVTLILTSRQGRMAINQAISLGRTLEAETVPVTRSGLQNPLAEPVQGDDSGMPLPAARRVDLQYRLLP